MIHLADNQTSADEPISLEQFVPKYLLSSTPHSHPVATPRICHFLKHHRHFARVSMALAKVEKELTTSPRGRSTMCSALVESSELSQLADETERLSGNRDITALRASAGNCAPNLLWREKVSQWCYDVVDHFGRPRDVVFITMNILDRYCAVRSLAHFGDEEKDYEIYVMTALFLGLRVSGTDDLDVLDLLSMTRNGVRLVEIKEAGESMMELLSWDFRIVTPFQFLQAFLRLSSSGSDDRTWVRSMADSASYLVEISVFDSFFSGRSSIVVALAALHCALREDTSSTESSRCKANREAVYQNMVAASGIPQDDEELVTLRVRLQSIHARSSENCGSSPHIIPFVDDDTSVRDESQVLLRRNDDACSIRTTPAQRASVSHAQNQQAIARTAPLEDLPKCAPNPKGDMKRAISPGSPSAERTTKRPRRPAPA